MADLRVIYRNRLKVVVEPDGQLLIVTPGLDGLPTGEQWRKGGVLTAGRVCPQWLVDIEVVPWGAESSEALLELYGCLPRAHWDGIPGSYRASLRFGPLRREEAEAGAAALRAHFGLPRAPVEATERQLRLRPELYHGQLVRAQGELVSGLEHRGFAGAWVETPLNYPCADYGKSRRTITGFWFHRPNDGTRIGGGFGHFGAYCSLLKGIRATPPFDVSHVDACLLGHPPERRVAMTLHHHVTGRSDGRPFDSMEVVGPLDGRPPDRATLWGSVGAEAHRGMLDDASRIYEVPAGVRMLGTWRGDFVYVEVGPEVRTFFQLPRGHEGVGAFMKSYYRLVHGVVDLGVSSTFSPDRARTSAIKRGVLCCSRSSLDPQTGRTIHEFCDRDGDAGVRPCSVVAIETPTLVCYRVAWSDGDEARRDERAFPEGDFQRFFRDRYKLLRLVL